MPFYERGEARIHYQDVGSGFPLFIIHGGGLDSAIHFANSPFDATAEFKSEYRCITMDLRNSSLGRSTGPLDVEHPWDMHADDQLGLLDHLGIDRFLVMGFCIGNPLIWNILRRASERVVAAVSAQPSGIDPAHPDIFYTRNLAKWAPAFCARRPEVSMETVEQYLRKMYKDTDFVITASRDFVRNCQTPLLVLPDDTESHPYVTAMEMVDLAPNVQVSLYPWKKAKKTITLAVRQIRTFLKAHCPPVTISMSAPERSSGLAGRDDVSGPNVSSTDVTAALSVADRLEIHELIARYNTAEDSGDVEGWVDTFTKDGSFSGLRQGNTIAGHDALRKFGLKRKERPGVDSYVHHVSNVVVTPTAEGAMAQCYVMIVQTKPDGTFGIQRVATKTDELRREDGKWRFKSRVNVPWPEFPIGHKP